MATATGWPDCWRFRPALPTANCTWAIGPCAADRDPFTGAFKGHEFHYATTLKADGAPLFEAEDAEGNALPPMGLFEGRVCGSFAHVIDTV